MLKSIILLIVPFFSTKYVPERRSQIVNKPFNTRAPVINSAGMVENGVDERKWVIWMSECRDISDDEMSSKKVFYYEWWFNLDCRCTNHMAKHNTFRNIDDFVKVKFDYLMVPW